MKVAELSEKTVVELQDELHALRREQFNLKMQRGAGHAMRTHLFRQVRRNIARVHTVLQQKKAAKEGVE